jgi:cardiolipin synthase A/B
MHKNPFQFRSPLVTFSILVVIAIVSGFLLHISPAHAVTQHTYASHASGSGVQGVQVFVEPAAGEQPILDAINNAQTSVYVEMYLLTDTNVINALENAAQNGLDVRVMLEQHPYGGGSPAGTLQALSNAGARTAYSNPAFTYTHEKGMIIDSTTAYIMSCNFTRSALGGSSSTKNREYGIIDANSADVQTALGVFNADWNRSSYTLTDDNIVLSPVNSRSDFTDLINSAQNSLEIEAEEMADSSIEQAIVNAEARGVKVQVILPNSNSNSAGISTLDSGGVSVSKDTQYYMHAKMMIVDGTMAFVGSENISTNSLDNNREMGLLISDSSVISTLQSTFQNDLNHSQAA